MKKTILTILILVSVLILVMRFTPKIAENVLGIKSKGGISISSTPSDAIVFLDGAEVGRTPYKNEELAAKEYLIKLEKDQASWQGKVSLNNGTLTAINRDLSAQIASSSGEILSLEKGRGLAVISNPNNSDVEVDGKLYGKTPLTINIEEGVHTILVTHPNFLPRSLRASITKDYKLTISIDLALSEADLTAVTTPVIGATEEVIVKKTPTNFLRIREEPSLSSKELARVKPGDTLVLLEEKGEWMKIRTPQGIEGYVSSVYVEKKQGQ